MQNQGFVKLYRKLLDSDVKSLGVVGIGFMAYCLLKANHKDNKWFDGSKFLEIKRGQFVTSSLELANELKLGRQVIRTTIRKFEELEIITTKATNRYTLMTIVNYSKYQDKYMPANQQTNQQPTSDQPASQPQSKKLKNEKNNITLHRRRRQDFNKKIEGEPSQSGEPSRNRNPDIKRFIDFFCEASHRIRHEKPVITRGKDGWLVKLALRKLSESQLEQMALWFLDKKKTLSTTIGAMLSKSVLGTLREDMNRHDFWKEINSIYDKYYPRSDFTKELTKRFKPFTSQQITEIQEEVSALIRPSGLYYK